MLALAEFEPLALPYLYHNLQAFLFLPRFISPSQLPSCNTQYFHILVKLSTELGLALVLAHHATL